MNPDIVTVRTQHKPQILSLNYSRVTSRKSEKIIEVEAHVIPIEKATELSWLQMPCGDATIPTLDTTMKHSILV